MPVNSTKSNQIAAVMTAKIVKGLLYVDRKYVAQREYLADNKSDKDKLLVVEHPAQQGWTLVDSPKPYETTSSMYRFELPVPAKKTASLLVKEQSVQTQTLALLNADLTQLLAYGRTGEIPANVRSAIAKVAQLAGAVSEIDRQSVLRIQQAAEIGVDQARIRENMKTVGQTSQYYQRLLSKLNDQESSIEKLRLERDDLQTRRDAARKELEDYLRDLTVG